MEEKGGLVWDRTGSRRQPGGEDVLVWPRGWGLLNLVNAAQAAR